MIEDLARARAFPCVMNAQFNTIDNEERERERERRRGKRREMYPSHHRRDATDRVDFLLSDNEPPSPSAPPSRALARGGSSSCLRPRPRPRPVIESAGQRRRQRRVKNGLWQNKHRLLCCHVRSLTGDGPFFSALRPIYPLFAALFIINNDSEVRATRRAHDLLVFR